MTSTTSLGAENSTRDQIRGSSLLLVGRGLAILAGITIQVLIVRFLSKEDFGAFAYGLTIVTFLSVIISMGLDQAVTRFAALYDEERRHDYLLGAVALQVVVVVVLGVFFVATIRSVPDLLIGSLVEDPDAVGVLRILVFLAPLLALDGIVTNLFAVYGRPTSIFVRRYLVSPALKIAVVVAVILSDAGLAQLATGYVVAAAVALAVYLMALVRLLRQRQLLARRLVLPVRSLFRFTLLVAASDLVVIMLFASDTVLVGLFHDTEGVAALQAIQPLANGNQLIFGALLPLFIPLATRLYARRDHPGLSAHVTRSTLWAVVFSAPVLFVCIGSARGLTELLFGSEYRDSAPVFVLLAIGNYAQGAFGLTALTLKVVDHLGGLIIANVLVAALNLGLNILLIPRMGALGAAVGTAVSLLILAAVKVVLLKRATGIDLAVPGIVRALLFTTIGAASIFLFERLTGPGVLLPGGVALLLGWLQIRLFASALDIHSVFPLAGRSRILRVLVGPPAQSGGIQ